MTFTSVPVSGTIKQADGSLTPGAIVTFILNVGISDGETFVSPEPVSVVCDETASFTHNLLANDDTTTTPTGTFYSVAISPAGKPWETLDSFNIVVPKADSAGVNLFMLAQLINPTTVSPYVSQIIAGTGVTVAPTGGTGAVTINASGVDGGSGVSITSPDGSIVVGGTATAPTLETVTTPTGQEWVNVLATPFSNVRWNTIAQSSVDYFGGELQSDGTQNDEVVFEKYLQAGTYTMDLFYKTGASHGIFSIFVDGVQLGTTIDSWVSSGGAMLRATIAGIPVSGNTVHAIRLLMATKNASATSYFGIVGGISMTRTGA